MAVGTGHKSFMNMGREAVWGTKVAATQSMELVSEDVRFVPGFALDPSLYNQRERRGVYRTGYFYRGTIRVRVNYTGMLLLFDTLMGTGTFGSKGVTTTGTGPWTHLFKIKTILNSLSIELIEGDIPSTKANVLTGAKVRGATFTVEAADSEAGMMTVDLDVIAKDKLDTQVPTATFTKTGDTTSGAATVANVSGSTTYLFKGMPVSGTGIPVGTTILSVDSNTGITLSANATATNTGTTITFTLSPAPEDPIIFTQATVINDGITSINPATGKIVKRAEIRIAQPTTEADRKGIGSGLIREPLPNNFMEGTWSFKEEFEDVTLLQAAAAATNGTPELRFASPITGNFIRFRSVQAQITDFPGEPITGYGPIEQDVVWSFFKGSANSDASGMIIEVVSTTETGAGL